VGKGAAYNIAIDLENTMEVNGYCQLSGYHHSSKYILPCSARGLGTVEKFRELF